MTQIRNVYILFEKGLEPLEPHIKEALEDVMSCFPEHRMDYPLIVLGDWQTESYMRINDKGETVLRPYESVEWYIARAKRRSMIEGRFQRTGQISANQLSDDLLSDPYAKEIPQWSVLITKSDLYASGINYCLGYSQENKFSIVSVARFFDQNGNLDIENFKTVLMHEFGHLIGLTNEKRANTEEKLGAHCINDGCVMQQRMNGNFSDITKIRLRRKRFGKPPICQDCIREGNKFFVMQKLLRNLIHSPDNER